MPPLPGEERLVTLFADVHYYFDKPTARPARHRFDKASYFYVYYNSTRQTSRIEIANNPGTEFQDAVNGQLERCRIRSSYTFPTLLTLEVDADGLGGSPISSTLRGSEEWRLESAELAGGSDEKHKLHTLDIYFWTVEDGKLATEYFKKLLGPSQLDIVELPTANVSTRQHERLSPVVQNLENVAKSDPAYGNGQTRNSQNQPQPQAIKLPPPPPLPQSDHSRSNSSAYLKTTVGSSGNERVGSPDSQRSAADYTPVAYNPAAPAAPEPRAHREKTPPPEDETEGTGLTAAVAHSHGYNSNSSLAQQPQYRHYGSPPPPSATSGYGTQPSLGYNVGAPPPPPPPPPQQSDARSTFTSGTSSFAPPPSSGSPGYGAPSSHQYPPRSSQSSTAMTFAPPPLTAPTSHDIHQHSSAAEHYTPEHSGYQHEPAETPGTEFYKTLEQPARPLQHIRPQYPDVLADRTSPALPGSAYAQHVSGSHAPPQRHDSDPYSVHNQVYRPTEAEVQSHRKPSRNSNSQSATSRIDSTADKLKGRFMKRFG